MLYKVNDEGELTEVDTKTLIMSSSTKDVIISGKLIEMSRIL